MILTFIFTLVGCTAHNEPDKKAVESSSTNAVIDTTQVEKLSEKAEGRTVEKSTFLEETTHSPAAETSTEKVSKEPIFSQTTTANTEPKQDIHTQKEMPKSEASEPEITTNTVSEVITTVEENEEFDISYWISYAQNYAQSIEEYKNALRRNPKDDETRYNLRLAQLLLKKQQQEQQNQDKNDDKDQQDKNKDQQKDQKQDQQEQNNNQNNQDKNKDQQEQNKPQQQQPQQSQMSKENAQQILDAIQQDERDTQEKVQKALMQQQKRKKTDKEW